MLKRLLALLFRKKKPVQETVKRRPAGSLGYQPEPFQHKVAPPPKRPSALRTEPPAKRYKPTPLPQGKNFNGQTRRGMTVDQNSSRLQQQDDMLLAMAVHQTYVAPSPIRSHDDDSCRVSHTPSYRHSDPDPSPSYDGGSDSGYSGGSGCD